MVTFTRTVLGPWWRIARGADAGLSSRLAAVTGRTLPRTPLVYEATRVGSGAAASAATSLTRSGCVRRLAISNDERSLS